MDSPPNGAPAPEQRVDVARHEVDQQIAVRVGAWARFERL
jgi:hypothetical protein